MKRFLLLFVPLWFTLAGQAAQVERQGAFVTVRPDGGEARVVRLQVMADGIIRVRATSEEALPEKQRSLMIVEQKAKPMFTVEEDARSVRVKAAKVTAVVDKRNGRVAFLDASGRRCCKRRKRERHSSRSMCRSANSAADIRQRSRDTD